MILPVNAFLNQFACMQFPSLCLGNYHLFLKARQLPELVLRATTEGASEANRPQRPISLT